MISFAHMHAYSYASAVKDIPEIEFVGIYDDDRNRGEEAARKYGTVFFDKLDSLIKKGIDGAIICSENSKHKQYALECCKSKITVLCEKPIASTLNDGMDMLKAFENAGVPLYIAFPCRFHSAVEKVREAVRSGAIGKVLAIKATNHGQVPGGWFIKKELSGGGAIIDHTVHIADLIRWFTDQEFAKVYAEKGELLYETGIDDCGMLSMVLENGVFATLDTSWSRPKAFPIWGDITMEIVGGRGVAQLDMFAQNLTVYEQGEITARYENFGDNADYRMILGFVSALKGEATNLATGYDGYKALEVAINAYKAADKETAVNI